MSETVKRAVRSRDGMRCTECGLSNREHQLHHGKSLHVHRLVPGKPYTLAGCVTLCFNCHKDKPRSPAGLGSGVIVLPERYRKAIHVYQGRYLQENGFRPNMTDVLRLALDEFLDKRGVQIPPD